MKSVHQELVKEMSAEMLNCALYTHCVYILHVQPVVTLKKQQQESELESFFGSALRTLSINNYQCQCNESE